MKQGARAGSGEEGTCNGRFAKKGCMRRTCAAAGIAAARAGPAGEREADGQPLAAAEADRDLREVRRCRGGGRTGWMAHFYSLKVAEGCGLERIRRAVVAQLEALFTSVCLSTTHTHAVLCPRLDGRASRKRPAAKGAPPRPAGLGRGRPRVCSRLLPRRSGGQAADRGAGMAGVDKWGSRSVEIFEKVEQVGEGTYGARHFCAAVPARS